MDTTLTPEQCKSLFAGAKAAGELKLLHVGERLDIFPQALPVDNPPPLLNTTVEDATTPVYLFGWQYPRYDFCQSFGGKIGRMDTHFKSKILEPLIKQHPNLKSRGPHFTGDIVGVFYTVYVACNYDAHYRARAQDEEVVADIMALLQETRVPMWHRQG
ncbi:hypothetical protein BD626DRAFT_573709 [Schizophyllum amplum]|uniref:Uncharacterized protein n=1 Tax=Schizophyllum amplum TaxID=97359 RepID=A0A550C0F2_9AGAR|nr:hypothetical protein BD626DRAFT_573709 [Auriculariopsis ampla]